MPNRKVGLRDIAEHAGVAISTVSHALNGTAPISEEVRNRILGIAGELGYLAKRQAKGTIATLAKVMLAVPEGALPHSDVNLVSWTILNALSKECEQRGLRLLPYPMDADLSGEQVLAAAREMGADGLILVNDDRRSLLETIGASGIPAVLINGEDPGMNVDSVTPGNRFAAQMATERLIALGHRRILHLTWRGRKTVRRRADGFLDAFAERGLPPEDALILLAKGYEPQQSEAALLEWMAENPDMGGVTALFCAADNLAFGAIRALRQNGFRVPEDVSVMGFDGVALGELYTPALSTVSVPMEMIGRAALGLLEQRMIWRGGHRPAHRLELGCTLIERATVTSPRR